MVRIDHERLYLSRSGAADLLGVSKFTIDRLIKAGELTAYKLTCLVLIPREAIDEMIKGRRIG